MGANGEKNRMSIMTAWAKAVVVVVGNAAKWRL
jgi:hypothetical protein